MGICEIILDQNKAGTEGDPSENIIVTHLFISLLMFCGCNIFILIHVIYITQYVLRVSTTILQILFNIKCVILGPKISLASQLSLFYIYCLGNNFRMLCVWQV
jgi:hypothetical protein